MVAIVYRCECIWNFPTVPPRLPFSDTEEIASTECPLCRGVVNLAWCEMDIRLRFITLSEAAKKKHASK